MTRPAPSWWAEARRLRAEGEREGRPWTVAALSVQLEKSESAIRYALNDDLRERQRRQNRETIAARYRTDPEFRERAKENSREWRRNNRAHLREKQRERYANDPAFRERRKAQFRKWYRKRQAKAEQIAAE